MSFDGQRFLNLLVFAMRFFDGISLASIAFGRPYSTLCYFYDKTRPLKPDMYIETWFQDLITQGSSSYILEKQFNAARYPYLPVPPRYH